jgi:hypothetical protein
MVCRYESKSTRVDFLRSGQVLSSELRKALADSAVIFPDVFAFE